MNDQAAETPLLDLLRGVPEDGRAWYEHDSTNHQNVPYGRLCKRAADALEQAQGKVACSAAIEKGAVKALSTAAERIAQLEALLSRWLEADDWTLRDGFEISLATESRELLETAEDNDNG